MYRWACHKYCKKCGGTNLWFVVRNDRTEAGKKRVKFLNICKECYNDYQRKRTEAGYWKTERTRDRIRDYRNKNRENIRRMNREYKARKKIKDKRDYPEGIPMKELKENKTRKTKDRKRLHKIWHMVLSKQYEEPMNEFIERALEDGFTQDEAVKKERLS